MTRGAWVVTKTRQTKPFFFVFVIASIYVEVKANKVAWPALGPTRLPGASLELGHFPSLTWWWR